MAQIVTPNRNHDADEEADDQLAADVFAEDPIPATRQFAREVLLGGGQKSPKLARQAWPIQQHVER